MKFYDYSQLIKYILYYLMHSSYHVYCLLTIALVNIYCCYTERTVLLKDLKFYLLKDLKFC